MRRSCASRSLESGIPPPWSLPPKNKKTIVLCGVCTIFHPSYSFYEVIGRSFFVQKNFLLPSSLRMIFVPKEPTVAVIDPFLLRSAFFLSVYIMDGSSKVFFEKRTQSKNRRFGSKEGTRMAKTHHPQVQVLQKPGNGLKEVLLTTVSACLIPAQLLYPTTLLCKRKSRHFLYIKLDVSKLLFFIYLYYRTRAPKFELKKTAAEATALIKKF